MLEVYKRETPYEVILAPECTPWSQMQNQNAKNPNPTKKRRVARGAEREFCNDSNALTDKCGKYYVLEQPKGRQMPKQLELSTMMKTALVAEIDMCTQRCAILT